MSLAELTRNCFQSGISPSKWLELCKLYVSIELQSQPRETAEIDLSSLPTLDSVLLLYRSYPGDPDLQAYLKHAIEEGSLSIAIFVSTLLQAARSPELHAPATLDTLCRVALDAHYSPGLTPLGEITSYNPSSITFLGIIQDALALLRTAHSLPLSHFHQLTTSASELVILLLSRVSDISQISTAQAMVYFADANDLLQNFRLGSHIRQVLETFTLSLSLLIGDDAKAAREAQIMHTIQLALGKGSMHGTSSETDTIVFSLFFHHLVLYRAQDFGAGDSQNTVAMLVALFRWAGWSPTVFYTQMLLSSFTCLSQSTSNTWVWKGFIVGRLPRLLVQFESSVNAEGVTSTDWRRALQVALQTTFRRSELIARCDHAISAVRENNRTNEEEAPRSFSRDLLQNALQLDLVPTAFAISLDSLITNDDLSRLQSEANDNGVDLEAHLESKLSPDTSAEDLRTLIDRISQDAISHSSFATMIYKRFTQLSSALDVDSLSHLCKVLYTYEAAMDIVALYMKISDLISRALAFLDRYDCETVGDPQTAVSLLGDVVLFVQYTISRFHLAADLYTVELRSFSSLYLKTTDTVYSVESLTGDYAAAFSAWFKALFDSGSEGIEDSILRSTRPTTLLRISATLFLQAIKANLDKDTLNNGVSYFTGPLLNWTLAGIIKALAKEIVQKRFSIPTHIDILQTLLLSPSCPRPVIILCAPTVWALLNNKKGQAALTAPGIDTSATRQVVAGVLGFRAEGQPPIIAQTALYDEPRRAIQTALASGRAGKAPAIDVGRCIRVVPPTKFLQLLWSELVVSASVGEMDICRWISTFILTMPRNFDAPPLLPVFLHVVAPALISAMDQQPSPDHTMKVELLVMTVSSALTAALHLELGIRTVTGEHRFVLGQSSAGMARKFATDLRARRDHTSRTILQQLASSQSFVANFPVFMGELG